MKTAVDLPDDLVREIKIHAVKEGRKLKDVFAELLRRGLENLNEGADPAGTIVTDPETGLPMIVCRHPADAANRLTPSRVAEILLDQEVAWNLEAGR